VKKTILFTVFGLSLAFFIQQVSSLQNESRLLKVLSLAHNQGEVKVESLDPNFEDISSINKYLLTDLTSAAALDTQEYSKQYVVQDTSSDLFLKVSTVENSNTIKRIQDFEEVLVDENISFAAQSNKQAKLNEQVDEELKGILNFLGLKEQRNKIEAKSKVTVAVIDSGLYNITKYQNKLYANEPEKSGKVNFDEDENGYFDDIYGWNLLNNTNQVSDLSGHGTHVTGIIMGLAELLDDAENIEILPIQVLGKNNEVQLSELIKAIRYAEKRGADIINLSLGSAQHSQILENTLNKVINKDIIVVAPSGNGGKNNIYYPAAYNDVLAVASLNFLGNRSPYSNYGSKVDFSVKGAIISLGKDDLIYKSGTSQSTAVISGLLAVFKAEASDMATSSEVIEIFRSKLESKTDDLGSKVKLKTLFGVQKTEQQKSPQPVEIESPLPL
jgi:subtilisin family serine protease